LPEAVLPVAAQPDRTKAAIANVATVAALFPARGENENELILLLIYNGLEAQPNCAQPHTLNYSLKVS
jgi:hypothetical protein